MFQRKMFGFEVENTVEVPKVKAPEARVKSPLIVEEAEMMMPTVVEGRIASPAGVNCQS